MSKMDSTKIRDLKVCLKTIVTCYIPNAIPFGRVCQLVGFILGEEHEEALTKFGVKQFAETYLKEDATTRMDVSEGALIHAKCIVDS